MNAYQIQFLKSSSSYFQKSFLNLVFFGSSMLFLVCNINFFITKPLHGGSNKKQDLKKIFEKNILDACYKQFLKSIAFHFFFLLVRKFAFFDRPNWWAKLLDASVPLLLFIMVNKIQYQKNISKSNRQISTREKKIYLTNLIFLRALGMLTPTV